MEKNIVSISRLSESGKSLRAKSRLYRIKRRRRLLRARSVVSPKSFQTSRRPSAIDENSLFLFSVEKDSELVV